MAFSADGKHLLSASDDRSVRLWNADSGREVGTFLGHTNSVWGVCFAPDGRLALSCGSDGSVRLWGLPRFVEVVRPGLLRQFQDHPGKVNAVAISPDGRLLLSGGDDRLARLWNLGGGAVRFFAGHTGAINAVAFTPDGRRLATASDDGSVRLWDTHKGGKELRRFDTGGVARSVTFTPDGRSLLAGSAEGSVRLWTVDSGKVLQAFKGHTGAVNAVAVAADGRRVLTAGTDTTVPSGICRPARSCSLSRGTWRRFGRPLLPRMAVWPCRRPRTGHCVSGRRRPAQSSTPSRLRLTSALQPSPPTGCASWRRMAGACSWQTSACRRGRSLCTSRA